MSTWNLPHHLSFLIWNTLIFICVFVRVCFWSRLSISSPPLLSLCVMMLSGQKSIPRTGNLNQSITVVQNSSALLPRKAARNCVITAANVLWPQRVIEKTSTLYWHCLPSDRGPVCPGSLHELRFIKHGNSLLYTHFFVQELREVLRLNVDSSIFGLLVQRLGAGRTKVELYFNYFYSQNNNPPALKTII